MAKGPLHLLFEEPSLPNMSSSTYQTAHNSRRSSRRRRASPCTTQRWRQSTSTTIPLALTTTTTLLLLLSHPHQTTSAPCDACTLTPNGFAVVPGSGCQQYVSCQDGVAAGGGAQSCNSGLIFDLNIKGCNWDYMVTCPPDPVCEDEKIDEKEEEDGDDAEEEIKCEIDICASGQSGNVVVPFSDCSQYVQCSMGVPGTIQNCPEGQMYSERIMACNIISQVTCPPDPDVSSECKSDVDAYVECHADVCEFDCSE
eukprot:g12300.t1 g12300   contig6:1653903-1654667(+)